MTRWFMMAGLLGACSFAFTVSDAHAQDNTGAKKKQAAKNKKGKKGGDNDGMGPFKKKDYPTSERLRPLVLPDGMGEVGLDAPISIISFAGESATGFGIVPSFNYGLGDMVELGISTGFPLAPDADWNRTLVPRVAFLAWDSKDFDFAPGVSIPLAFVDETGIGVLVDLSSRYVLSDGWFVYFGQGAIPLGVSPDVTLALNVNGGVGLQANPKTALTLDLNPISILVAPDFTATGIWDYLTLNFGAQYTPAREWDVGARLGVLTVWGAETSVITISPYARFRF
jgi:hypothetical protein